MSFKVTAEKNANLDYDKGCVMANVIAPEVIKLQQEIPLVDIYFGDNVEKYGLETNPHITLLFGLDSSVNTVEVESILDKFDLGAIQLNNMSIFSSDEYDVLKLEATNPELYEINEALKKLPFEASFRDYKPHLTIGYLIKGRAQQYVERFEGVSFTSPVDYFSYSTPEGKIFKYKKL